jgi:hypothetical protein
VSALVPPKLADLARELQLGELEVRFGYRPGVVGSAFLVLFAVPAVVGLFRLVFEAGGPVLAAVDLVALALVAWRVRRMYVRFRGGVYLFEGGIAEAYRDHVKKVFTWSEVKAIQRHRTLTVLNFIPVLFEDEYLITAQREDLKEADDMLLDSKLIGARQAVRMIANRIGQAGLM